MFVDEEVDIVKDETLKDLAWSTEHGDEVGRKDSFAFTMFKHRMILAHFQGEGKCRSLKAELKMLIMTCVMEGEGV